MKQWVAYIFLFIFSFQVLPVKEIGKILFKGQMTEEVHETAPDADDLPGAKIKKGFDPLHFSETSSVIELKHCNAVAIAAIHEAERILVQHVPDIMTPPPNCA